MASVQVDIDIDDIVSGWGERDWAEFVIDYRDYIESALFTKRPEYDLSDTVTRLVVIVELRRQGFKVELES